MEYVIEQNDLEVVDQNLTDSSRMSFLLDSESNI